MSTAETGRSSEGILYVQVSSKIHKLYSQGVTMSLREKLLELSRAVLGFEIR